MATRQFLSFAAVGVIGFVVDASVLHAVIHVLGTGPYTGRLLSYLAAATCTWALNRRYTFFAHRGDNRISEWARFLGTNAAGGLVNYGTYAALLATSPLVLAYPTVGVAAGSLAGLLVNFFLSRRLVFRNVSRSR